MKKRGIRLNERILHINTYNFTFIKFDFQSRIQFEIPQQTFNAPNV